jgi:hypothetical protein
MRLEYTSDRRGCDHYHAIPLSDGHHVLFIDAISNKLVLGCDAPLGGPSKLLHKIVFIPPEDKAVPRLYAAAADLSSGAIIVVVYDETIVLYSIPPEIIVHSQSEQKGKDLDSDAETSPGTQKKFKNHWLNWWVVPLPTDATTPFPNHQDSNSPWPIAIRGTKIDLYKGICEIAIQTLPDITIRAFTYSSKCKSWRLRSYVDPVVRTEQYVCRNRIVHDRFSIDQNED